MYCWSNLSITNFSLQHKFPLPFSSTTKNIHDSIDWWLHDCKISSFDTRTGSYGVNKEHQDWHKKFYPVLTRIWTGAFLNVNTYMYSSGRKSWIFCFAQLLLQILVNCQNQGQFWNLLVLRFPKLSLKVKFDKDLAEIIKVKDKWSVPKKCLILYFVFDLD